MLPTAQFGAAEAQDVGRSRHRWKLKLERSRESWKRGLAVSGPHPLTPTALVTVMRRDTFDRRSRWNACGHPVRAERPGGRAPSVKRTRATALVIRFGCHQGHRVAERQADNAFGLTPLDRRPLAGSQHQIWLFWFVTPNSALQRINGTSRLPALVFTRTMTSGESGSSYRGPVDR